MVDRTELAATGGDGGWDPALRTLSPVDNEGANLDPSQVGGGRGRAGGGGKIAIGGGAGVVVLILAPLLGVNPGELIGSGTDPGASRAPPSPFAQCTRGSDIAKDRNCRFVACTNSIQDYWGEAAQNYEAIKVTTSTGPTSPGVRLELLADCYAGVRFHQPTSDLASPISEVSDADLADALDPAAAVGDDRIRKKMQGQVTPESWTHGSAANRQQWLDTGFTSGDPNDCDTFTSGAVS